VVGVIHRARLLLVGGVVIEALLGRWVVLLLLGGVDGLGWRLGSPANFEILKLQHTTFQLHPADLKSPYRIRQLN